MTQLNEDDRVTGKVAEVVSNREVILNRGSDDGVERGDYFAVLETRAVGITDPDSGDDLGDIRVVKIVVRAVEVAPRLTLARTFRTRRINLGGPGTGLGSLAASMQAPRYVDQVETLKIDESAPRKIDPDESVVHRGDPFEMISKEEAEDQRSITVWADR